ncbi:N-acetylglutamate synthase [Vibrio aerogenes CECT 7868]|uniref:N-acetylglutamate synthase n=1 Tax=Vibrio aerogenes CECT 7868 TaxID=1216006 RepID=A0A1M5YTT3_9VIBR|nr:GNAT family N-acetyltransferase [Vibrio aerogenes]SHI14993.1 N-acetylglutamate synthase [Vibrio aerogenes CECT 7868]
MNQLLFEQLDPIKIPLIQRFYKQHYPSGKAKKDEQVIIAKDNQHQICAAVRFRHISNYQLLTGMTVATEKRQQGIGHQLLTFCEQRILHEQVYCFALAHLKDFYTTHHFRYQEPDTLPEAIRTLYFRYTRQGKVLIPMRYITPGPR